MRETVGTEARFNNPQGIVADGAGGFYVCDTINDTIRKIDSSGAVTTIAGKVLSPGLVDGKGGQARFNLPTAIARDHSGNLYLCDTGNNSLRKIDPAGTVTTIAPAHSFAYPQGIALDGSGIIYIADTDGDNVEKVTPTGDVTVFAGGLDQPMGITFDLAGRLIVANYGDNTIRAISPAGVVSTVAGTGRKGHADGPIDTADFYSPAAVAVDASGTIFVSDSYNSVLRKISGDQVTTLAGSLAGWGWKDGTGRDAQMEFPGAMVVGASGALYFCDYHDNTIRTAVPAQ